MPWTRIQKKENSPYQASSDVLIINLNNNIGATHKATKKYKILIKYLGASLPNQKILNYSKFMAVTLSMKI